MMILTGDALRDRVFESLNNAVENGFNVRSWTPDSLTDDLMAYDADLERCDRSSVLLAVREWMDAARHG